MMETGKSRVAVINVRCDQSLDKDGRWKEDILKDSLPTKDRHFIIVFN